MPRRPRPLLAVLALLAYAGPASAGPLAVSLGTARGLRAAEQTLDGARWFALGDRSLPILEGSRVRAAAGAALLDLADGTRVGILPFTTVQLRESEGRLEVALERGRLTFRWPAGARTVIRTATARLAPLPGEAAAGEVVSDTTTGIRLTSGRVEATGAAGPVLVASRAPVFLPTAPARPRVFAADGPPDRLGAGRPVFGPRGESVGYLEDARRLVVHPGFAADLTGAFPPSAVERAVAAIPPARRSEATPLFDVAGGYVGYVAGAGFFPMLAQAQGAPVFMESLEGGLGSGWPWYYYAGAVVAAGALGVGIAAAGGGSDAPATPVAP